MNARALATQALIAAAVGFGVATSGPIGWTAKAAGCDRVRDAQFICGMIAPEDLIAVPGTPWVIASGFTAGGAIHRIDSRDFTRTQLFPAASPRLQHDARTYGACPGPLDPAEKDKFSAHGLNLRRGANGVHTLYVVHHGFRESIEVFELDARPPAPQLTWIGCAVAPQDVSINSVSPVPDRGFVVTNITRRNLPNLQERMRTGGNTGELWEWHPDGGWKMVPESELPVPNGIEVSSDGSFYFVNLWSTGRVLRMSRGKTPASKDYVNVGFNPDNIRWQADGSLYTAGQGAPTPERIRECLNRFCEDATTNVSRIDPKTLQVQPLVRDLNSPDFISSTVGLRVGNEIWIGSSHSDRVARYPIK